jgi:hypothetical protein
MAALATSALIVINLTLWVTAALKLKPWGNDFWFNLPLVGPPLLGAFFSVLFPLWLFMRGFRAASVGVGVVLLMIALPVWMFADIVNGMPD